MHLRPPLTRATLRRLASLVVAGLVVGACGSGGGSAGGDGRSDGELRIVATTSILADLTAQLVGDEGAVDTLIPPGSDPHTYAPSAAQVAALRRADLIVANGLGLESALQDVLAAARADGVRTIEVGPEVAPRPIGDPDADAEHTVDDGHDHEPGSFDPHIWFDPLRMQGAVTVIARAIADTDDAPAGIDWSARSREVSDALGDLHTEVEAILAAVPDGRRRIVTNHDALGYLAARYDFEVVATVLPGVSTEAQSSARDLADLAELLRDLDVPAVFVDREASDDVARALANDLDIEVVALSTGSLGAPGSRTGTYADLLRATAIAIVEALA